MKVLEFFKVFCKLLIVVFKDFGNFYGVVKKFGLINNKNVFGLEVFGNVV